MTLRFAAPPTTPRRPATKLLHAFGLVAAAAWSSQLLAWVSMITVARLLSPADFGLVAMANVFLGLAEVVGDCGLRDAVIAITDITAEQLQQLNTVSVIQGMALFAVACAVAYPMERFFHAAHLHAVVITMSIAFVITAFRNVPAGQAYKEFRFKLIAKGRSAGALTSAAVTIVAALQGAGYWSLVLGSVAGASICTLVIVAGAKVDFAWPNLHALRRSLTLSFHILSNRIAGYIYTNFDFLTVGRLFGQAALGSYNMAWSLSNRPVQIIADQVWQVLPSYLSNAQKDDAELRQYVVTVSAALLLITLPASLGLSLLAKDVIVATVGAKWINSVLPLQLIVLYMPLSSVSTLLIALLYVRGQSRFVMWNNVLAAMYFPLAFYLASAWGTVGIALVWPLLYPAVALPLFIRTFREIHLEFKVYGDALRPAFTGSAMMVIGLLLVRSALPPSLGVYSRLFIQITVGSALYAITIFAVHGRVLRSLLSMIRQSSS